MYLHKSGVLARRLGFTGLTIYEIRRRAARVASRFSLPFFTARGWRVILTGAAGSGLVIGVALNAWTLAARGL